MRLRTAIVLLILLNIILIIGCTTTETRPEAVSWGDLIHGKRLDTYLEERLKKLASLEQKASSLEQRLYERRHELNNLDKRISNLKHESDQLGHEKKQLHEDIQRKRKELESAIIKAESLKKKEAELRVSFAELHDRREAEAQLTRYKIEIDQLEAEIANLERSIDRTIILRAKHALETH